MGGLEHPTDPLEEAAALVDAANHDGVPLRLIGGLAVRALCPDFPARVRDAQDIDLASVSGRRATLIQVLDGQGYVEDKTFNRLHGEKQLYFSAEDGHRTLDIVLDRIDMCHTLDFRKRIDQSPLTLSVTDLLLSKLQIVELNEKDAQDALYLLSAFPVEEGNGPRTIGLARFGGIVKGDWGWWRTVTRNLEWLCSVAGDDGNKLLPPNPPYDAVAHARRLRRFADEVPKSGKWRMRSVVGERVIWYTLPEEVQH